MWRFNDAELYCVSTNMRITSELMQFEIGTSTRRYLPPSGTAGLDRKAVSGNKRLPAPPPRITARRLCLEGISPFPHVKLQTATMTTRIDVNRGGFKIGG